MKKSKIIKEQQEHISELYNRIGILIEHPDSEEAAVIRASYYLSKDVEKEWLTGEGMTDLPKGLITIAEP